MTNTATQNQGITSGQPDLWQELLPSESLTGTQPLLKWPGGKRWLIGRLRQLVPTRVGRYFEGFAGGAALFFALEPHHAVLVDKSANLINCYTQVRNCPEAVIAALSTMKNTELDYYRIRQTHSQTPAEQAARLIYLVTLSFNGIYRENSQGMFNVPYGHKTHLDPCNSERIFASSTVLSRAQLIQGDFASAINQAEKGDLVYLDPPYTVAHGNNGFVKYNARMFSWDDQKRLATWAFELDRRGCRVIVSNAAHPSITALYENFERIEVERTSVIAANSRHRKVVTEYIFHNVR